MITIFLIYIFGGVTIFYKTHEKEMTLLTKKVNYIYRKIP